LLLVNRVPDDGLAAFVTAHAEGLEVRLTDASFDRRRLEDLHARVLSDGYTADVFRTLSIASDLAGVEVGVPDRATQVAVRLRWLHEPLLVMVRRVRLL